jgi:hypothetical protein
MALYEIICPVRQNNGQLYYMAHRAFRRAVGALAGGYTVLPECEGFWIDPETGQEYAEKVIPLRVACSASIFMVILAKHQQCYPDQECVMWYIVAQDVHFVSKPKGADAPTTEEIYNALTSD